LSGTPVEIPINSTAIETPRKKNIQMEVTAPRDEENVQVNITYNIKVTSENKIASENKKRRHTSVSTPELETEKRQKEDHCNLCASCINRTSKKCAPFVACTINGVLSEAIVDTGAQITVFKRTRRDLPVAKLKMKSATAHRATLYGPTLTQIELNGKKFPYPVYEAEVAENLIGYDFMDHFDARIRIRDKCLKLGPDHKVPFRVDKSITKGQFRDGNLYFVVRANRRMLLRPMMSRELQTKVETDLSADELGEASAWLTYGETDEPGDQGTSMVLSTPDSDSDLLEEHRASVELNTECTQIVHRNTNEKHAPGSHEENQPRRELKQVPRIGLFANNKFSERKTTKLPSSVLVQSGIIPCVTAPVTVTLINFGDKCVEIPKYAVVGEVFLVHPLPFSGYDLQDEFDEGFDEREESEAEVCACGLSWTEHEIQPHKGAEITKPREPPLEVIPGELQKLLERSSKHLDKEEKEQLEVLLKKHHDVFAKDNFTFGTCPWLKFRIDTGNHPPIKQTARPVPLHYRKEVKETFLKYLKMGAIRPSQSAWASPILCVPKKTGEVRVCVDYRALNAITRVPAAPIPRPQELLQHLAGKDVYHAVDLAHGYHNLVVHPDDQPKTAIILPEDLGLPCRQYEYTRMGFGLSAAPGAFQYVTDRLVPPAEEPNKHNDIGDTVAVYIDDVCIAGDNNTQMMQRLEAFLNRVRAGGFLLKPKKCELFRKEVSFLGHKLSKKGIKVDKKKIEQITHWPAPKDQKEVRSWLGLVQYYAKYVPHLATLAAPIFALIRLGVPFVWSAECEEAFKIIKQKLVEPPILGTPDITKGPFTLTCDASLTGLGAVLTQEQDGRDVTIAYWSKLLNRSQQNYCATYRELLALVESIKAYNYYLAGAPFIVRSDHAALQWLKNFKNPTGKLARWLERLAPYKFEVVHERGINIGHADALSRRPGRPCTPECKKCKRSEERDAEVNLTTCTEDHTFSSKNFTLLDIQGSLFSAPDHIPLCHAVSLDGKFGKGLALRMEERFGLKKEFLAQENRTCPGLVVAYRENRTIVNVITKLRYFNKPTPEKVEEALLTLKAWVMKYNIPAIAMPEFSCGLDKMQMTTLKQMLRKVFQDLDLTIYMYHYDLEHDYYVKTCGVHCHLCEVEDKQTMKPTPDDILLNWTTVAPDGVSPMTMEKDQKLDPDIMPIYVAVTEGKRPHFQDIVQYSNKTRTLWHFFNSLFIHGQLLFRRKEHVTGDPQKAEVVLILPQKHVKSTIMLYHSQLGQTNHFGIQKTVQGLKKFFWWPGMQDDVAEVLSNCVQCRKVKGPLEKTKVPLKIFQDGVLHGRWHVDTCGPYPETSEKYKYILIAIEAFSGWPVLVPLKTQTAKEMAQALITNVFSVYGAPLSILTDQAKAFESGLFQEIMELYNIKKYRTTAYHPSANGKAERWVRTLKQSLKLLCQGAKDKWVDYLPFIAQAYRSLPHSSHKFSPYEVLFGAPMRTPLHVSREPPPILSPIIEAYPWAIRNALIKIHEDMRRIRAEAATRMKAYYDRTACLAPFQPGNQVFLYNKAIKKTGSKKLHIAWLGPYKILTLLNDCEARIQNINKPTDIQLVHMDRLAPYPTQADDVGTWLSYSGAEQSDAYL